MGPLQQVLASQMANNAYLKQWQCEQMLQMASQLASQDASNIYTAMAAHQRVDGENPVLLLLEKSA